MAEKGLGPQKEHITNVYQHEYVVKLHSKYLCLYAD